MPCPQKELRASIFSIFFSYFYYLLLNFYYKLFHTYEISEAFKHFWAQFKECCFTAEKFKVMLLKFCYSRVGFLLGFWVLINFYFFKFHMSAKLHRIFYFHKKMAIFRQMRCHTSVLFQPFFLAFVDLLLPPSHWVQRECLFPDVQEWMDKLPTAVWRCG